MKLYTQEQVIDMLKLTNMNVSFYMDTMTPIELPNDEEIIKKAIIHTEAHTLKFIPRSSFIQGAKWVIDKIKNQ